MEREENQNTKGKSPGARQEKLESNSTDIRATGTEFRSYIGETQRSNIFNTQLRSVLFLFPQRAL